MEGGLGAQDAAFGSIGLVVKFHGVAVDARVCDIRIVNGGLFFFGPYF
jgi:hypothetical protein